MSPDVSILPPGFDPIATLKLAGPLFDPIARILQFALLPLYLAWAVIPVFIVDFKFSLDPAVAQAIADVATAAAFTGLCHVTVGAAGEYRV